MCFCPRSHSRSLGTTLGLQWAYAPAHSLAGSLAATSRAPFCSSELANFWPLGSLLRVGQSEADLLLVVFRQNAATTYRLCAELATCILPPLVVGYSSLQPFLWPSCGPTCKTYPHRRHPCGSVRRLRIIESLHHQHVCLEKIGIVEHIASCYGNHTV